MTVSNGSSLLDWLRTDRPGKTAIAGPEGEIGYATLADMVDSTCAWLQAGGVSPSNRVGVSLSGGPTRVWLNHLAVMRIGATCISLNEAFSAQIDAIGGVDFVVAHEGEPALQHFPTRVLAFNRDSFDAYPGNNAWATAVGPSDGSRLMTTSGTTGRPKGVLWDHQTASRRVTATLGISAETKLFPMLGIDTAGGFRYPLATWQAGGTVLSASVLPDSPSGVKAIETCNLMLASPAILRAWLRTERTPFYGRDKRRVVCAGGRLAIKLREQIHETLAARIDIAYGSTEAGSIARGDASIVDRHPGAVGYALPGVTIEIVDDGGLPVEAGAIGRVRVRSPNMVHHYWHAEGEVEAECFREGWFYPGDIGTMEADGLLVIHGRDGDTLNLDGRKIELGPIEQAVGEMADVTDCCALCVRTDRGDRLAIVVSCPDNTDLEALARSIRHTIPSLHRFTLVHLPQIPRNAMGKVPRLALGRRIEQTSAFRAKNGV